VISSLATGLERGYTAVLNSLALPYSSGRGPAVIPGNREDARTPQAWPRRIQLAPKRVLVTAGVSSRYM
jgi:hypothetical protein